MGMSSVTNESTARFEQKTVLYSFDGRQPFSSENIFTFGQLYLKSTQGGSGSDDETQVENKMQ
jgi:hypothetical protein